MITAYQEAASSFGQTGVQRGLGKALNYRSAGLQPERILGEQIGGTVRGVGG